MNIFVYYLHMIGLFANLKEILVVIYLKILFKKSVRGEI